MVVTALVASTGHSLPAGHRLASPRFASPLESDVRNSPCLPELSFCALATAVAEEDLVYVTLRACVLSFLLQSRHSIVVQRRSLLPLPPPPSPGKGERAVLYQTLPCLSRMALASYCTGQRDQIDDDDDDDRRRRRRRQRRVDPSGRYFPASIHTPTPSSPKARREPMPPSISLPGASLD